MGHRDILAGRSGPVLVVGMHRSGTRLLAELLGRLGIFMGADRQADAESVTFMLLNEAILHQCGAFWSEPMAAHFVLAEPETVARLAAGISAALEQRITDYTGKPAAAAGATAARICGWKDPRNTFTLPVWRHLFPGLRVIHLMRHGVDVAASLARRHTEALRAATGEAAPGALTVIRDDALGILSTRRGWTLAEALTMWEQYVEKARLGSTELGGAALELRFEQLIEEPQQTIAEVARFCELPGNVDYSEFLARLRPARRYAYRADPELAAFAEANRAVLERFGYAI